MDEWVVLEITGIKRTTTNNCEVNIYFEMCDPTGTKVASAITIPVPKEAKIPNFKTVIVSTMKPTEVKELLGNVGQ